MDLIGIYQRPEEVFDYLDIKPEEVFYIEGKGIKKFMITSNLTVLEEYHEGCYGVSPCFDINIKSLLKGEHKIIKSYERMKETMKVVKGKKPQMKLDDLKSGYVVQLRNGRYYMVMRVGNFTKVLVNGVDCQYLSKWDENLKSKSKMVVELGKYRRVEEHDIVKVYGLVQGTPNYTKALELTNSISSRELLWSREEAVKLTMEELCERLGYDVEIVKE